MHTLRVESFITGHLEKQQQHIAARLRGTGRTGNAKVVATAGYVDIEAAFYLSQVFIKLAAKVGQATIVGGLEDYIPRYLDSIQSTSKITARRLACLSVCHAKNWAWLR